MNRAAVTPTAAPPSGRTARRLEWRFLPPPVRAVVEQHCGSSVVETRSQGGGYTPGFASVLTCADGSRQFVKAASTKAQRAFADSYRQEARTLRALPAGAPAARLLWSVDDDWVILGLEYAAGRAPRRPWREDELSRCLDAAAAVAELLTPAPAELALTPITEELAGFASAWTDLMAAPPVLPDSLPPPTRARLEEAAELADGFATVGVGDTAVHTDLRDDNVILGGDRVWFCDWNWLTAGAAWIDTVSLLIQPRGDGLDVEGILESRPLTRDVPRAHIDSMLALLGGYFLRQSAQPEPPSSPHLRQHQAWCAEAVWGWLAERRGWS